MCERRRKTTRWQIERSLAAHSAPLAIHAFSRRSLSIEAGRRVLPSAFLVQRALNQQRRISDTIKQSAASRPHLGLPLPLPFRCAPTLNENAVRGRGILPLTPLHDLLEVLLRVRPSLHDRPSLDMRRHSLPLLAVDSQTGEEQQVLGLGPAA